MDNERKTLYIETTIPSLLTSRPSTDIIKAGRQAATKLFWDCERHKYDLFISQTDCFHLAVCVIEEIDFLLSWNCTHLGGNSQFKVRQYNEKIRLWTPVLITPDALLNIAEE
jgi:hypothetical protein